MHELTSVECLSRSGTVLAAGDVLVVNVPGQTRNSALGRLTFYSARRRVEGGHNIGTKCLARAGQYLSGRWAGQGVSLSLTCEPRPD